MTQEYPDAHANTTMTQEYPDARANTTMTRESTRMPMQTLQ